MLLKVVRRGGKTGVLKAVKGEAKLSDQWPKTTKEGLQGLSPFRLDGSCGSQVGGLDCVSSGRRKQKLARFKST